MKFKISTTESGKLGGNVFNRNGTVRAFAMPTISQSSKSIEQRNLQVAVKNAWKDLSLAEQAAWNAQGDAYKKINSVGDVRTPSGYQIFMGVNGTIQAAAGPPFTLGQVISVPPGRLAPPDLGATVNTVEGGALEIETANAGSVSAWIVVRATSNLGNGRTKASKSNYRIIYRDLDTTAPATTDIISEYQAVFGNLVTGQRIGVQISTVNALSGEEVINATWFGTVA